MLKPPDEWVESKSNILPNTLYSFNRNMSTSVKQEDKQKPLVFPIINYASTSISKPDFSSTTIFSSKMVILSTSLLVRVSL